MILTVLLGFVAGMAAPYAEDQVKQLAANLVLKDEVMSDIELRVVTFALLLVVAAILAALLGNGSALALSIGALLGALAPRLKDKIQGSKTPDYGDGS